MINIHTIHAAQEGDEDAIQQIFESFKQLMIFKTKKYFFHGGDREDVMQEAMIGLLKAINAYDESKNASFTTFALLCIKRQIRGCTILGISTIIFAPSNLRALVLVLL